MIRPPPRFTLFPYTTLFRSARYPELELDDPSSKVVKLPETRPTVMVGLHYILPVIVLVWCLMVERLSPGLSALDRKSTRLNSSHVRISYAVFCLKKKKKK